MGLKQPFVNIFQTRTIRHFSITTFGTALNGFLGLLFYIVTARNLGPEIYGALAVAVASIALLSDIADMGVDTAILRFIGKYHDLDKDKSLQFLKMGLTIKLAIWLVILVVGWFTAPKVAEVIFLKPGLTFALRFALIGVGGALIFSLVTHAIQAFEKFWLWSFLNIGMNGLRLLAVLFLIFIGRLNLISTLTVYISMFFLGFFASLFLLPNFLKARGEGSVAGELLNYSKWVALVGILAATASRMDTFISARFLSVAQVGIYSVAVQLSSVILQLVFALSTVIAPKLAGFNNDEKAMTYLKKLQTLVFGLSIFSLLGIPLSFYFIPLVYGQVYSASVAPFIILLLAQLLFLLALPVHQAIFYYFSKPSIMSWVSMGQLIIAGSFGWFLISSYGIIGAATTVLVINLFGLLIPGMWVVLRFAKRL